MPYLLNELVLPILQSDSAQPLSYYLREMIHPVRFGTSTFFRELTWLVLVSVRQRISFYLTWWLPRPVGSLLWRLKKYFSSA
jgi:hypothetical protein